MLRDILKSTIPNAAVFISGSDPTIEIRYGRAIDSKRASIFFLKASRRSDLYWGFINTKPEGPKETRGI
jgi:hypothetical protein